MKLFDSHSHIDDTCYDHDFENMLQRARDIGVEKIMIAGIDYATSRKAIALSAAHPGLVTSVGLHPHDAAKASRDLYRELASLAAENDCVRAWGETGLDFNRMHSSKNVQEKCFEEQLVLADELDLPLIFHERDSQGRFHEIIKAYSPRRRHGVVHCFSGNKEELFNYLDLGYHIGITGILTIPKRGAPLRELVSLVPADRLLIETDAPYLTPKPQRNKFRRNEPAFVASVLETLAAVREEEISGLAHQIWNNTCTLFDIDSD